MPKTLLVFLSLFIWVGVIVAAIYSYPGIVASLDEMSEGQGQLYFFVSAFFIGLIGIYLNTVIIDVLAKKSSEDADLTPEARHKLALGEADQHLANKEYKLAIATYERIGNLHKALELAQQHNERGAMARVFFKLGKYDRARKIHAELGEWMMAGHLSVLMGDVEESRKYYGEATKLQRYANRTAETAGVYDRAGKRAEAAAIYEEAGDFTNAADCWELAGDPARAHQIRERGEIISAYEKSKSSDNINTPKRRANLRDQAREMEEFGDFYGAAQIHRDGSDLQKAGALFEKCREFERAARCFRKQGDAQKADEMTAKGALLASGQLPQNVMTSLSQAAVPKFPSGGPIPPPSGAVPKPPTTNQVQLGGPKAPPPPPSAIVDPRTLGPVQFIPVIQREPVYIPVTSGGAGILGAKQLIDMATELERTGKHAQAADINLQIGRVDEAMSCLSQGLKPFEAAMLAIGTGNYAEAAELLVRELEMRTDPEVGLLLGEMLVRLKEYQLAQKLLKTRLAPTITNENSQMVFEFGALFEEAGELDRAAEIYKDLIRSGATSDELTRRLKDIERKQRDSKDLTSRTSVVPEGEGPGGTMTQAPTPSQEKVGAQDFLNAMLDENSVPVPPKPTQEAPPPPPATSSRVDVPKVGKPFMFAPKVHRPRLTAMPPPTPPKRTGKSDPLAEQVRQISLFSGSVVGQGNRASSGSVALPGSARDEDVFAAKRRYEVIKELGKGGMGVVYEAEDTILQRTVALKLINSFDAGPENLKQFLVEARAIARLNHPNVITIYDVGMVDLRHYLAMEFVDGKDLKNLITTKQKLPVKEALRFFLEIGSGLQAAHEAGIVHRDIKPANVLLTKDLRAKIVDFGLAKLGAKSAKEGGEEETNFKSAGTPGYMAPEQIHGGELTPACDIYALGITLFTMLTGDTPHKQLKITNRSEIAEFQILGKYPSIREFRDDVPPAIDQIFKFCTTADVGSRYQRMEDILPAVKQWHDAV